MNCRIIAIDNFRREAKRLLKKFPSLKAELLILEQILLDNPHTGIEITSNTYKIRLAVKSKGKGKSGGMRIITHVVEIELQIEAQETETTVFLLSIYDKSEEGNISDKELRGLIEDAIQNLDDV
jgi:hypothetical protein